MEVWVHAPRCVAHKERLDAQLVHHSLREGNLLHVIALIEMETAFHRHDVLAAQLAEDELACVAFYGRYGEVGYLTIWKLVAVSYL